MDVKKNDFINDVNVILWVFFIQRIEKILIIVGVFKICNMYSVLYIMAHVHEQYKYHMV